MLADLRDHPVPPGDGALILSPACFRVSPPRERGRPRAPDGLSRPKNLRLREGESPARGHAASLKEWGFQGVESPYHRLALRSKPGTQRRLRVMVQKVLYLAEGRDTAPGGGKRVLGTRR